MSKSKIKIFILILEGLHPKRVSRTAYLSRRMEKLSSFSRGKFHLIAYLRLRSDPLGKRNVLSSSILLSDDSFLMLKQEAYRSMASALSEADGIDYTDPEEVGSKSMILKSLLLQVFLIPVNRTFS